MKDLLFYDIEVFKYDSMVVFKSIDKKVIKIFHNDFTGLKEFIFGKILVGFNNYHYDDKILTYMYEGKSQFLIKELNDQIIGNLDTNYINKPLFRSLDVFQEIDTSKPSLKKIEGNMGRKILESSVPFTIDRPLTSSEVKEVIFYCSYDVDTTIDIYKIRDVSYFQPKASLIEMLGNPKAQKWNTTSISASLLLDRKLPKWNGIRIDEKFLSLVPQEIREYWNANVHINGIEKPQDSKDKGVTIEEFGCEIQFGKGGLHGAHKHIKKEKRVKILDVRSMYPNIILILNVLAEASKKYKEILDQRLAIKHTDPILSESLKLILNSVFGNLINSYSMLYNPNAGLSVCIYGQIALYELCKRISKVATIVNINTDGVAFITSDDRYIGIYKEWEVDFNLILEEKEFSQFIQKDVNNYIAISGEKMTCKGGDVNKYPKDLFFKNNDARIIDIAFVDHIVHGKDILKSIMGNLDKPHLFQYILNTSSKFLGTFDEAGNRYNKVNRVFASQKEGFCLFKRRHDDTLIRFPDAPSQMFLWNQDCSEIEDFADIVDIDHYYLLTRKRLERWM
jgi:hypothetical protein